MMSRQKYKKTKKCKKEKKYKKGNKKNGNIIKRQHDKKTNRQKDLKTKGPKNKDKDQIESLVL